jgi:hypothetical protein
MPDEGIVCDVDAGPFSTVTWDDVFAELDGNSTRRSVIPIGNADYLPQWKF